MIIEKYFHTTVSSHEGNVSIQINETVTNTVKIQNEIEALVKNIPGIRNVSFTMKSPTIRSAMHK
jgi:cell division protein FtsX